MIDDRITQTDLNLAINYMVIEQLTKCMGVDKYLFDEHDWLPVVFKRAANGTLNGMFTELGEGGKDGLETLFEKLHNIFGLSDEVFSGERQINLGIGVDQDNDHAVELATTSMDDLNDYIEQHSETCLNEDSKSTYSEIPWFNAAEAERMIDEVIMEQIGYAVVHESTRSKKADKQIELKKAILKWSNNPLGLNTLGLFIYLLEEGLLTFETPTDNNDDIDPVMTDTFDKSFSNIKFTEKQGKDSTAIKVRPKGEKKGKGTILQDEVQEAKLEYTIAWKQNIYCFDSIVYSILRKWKYLLEGYSINGKREHKILDGVSDLLPAPLKLVDTDSELIKMIDTLWTTNCDSLGGYNFDFKYTEFVRYSSIEKEIDHYKNEVLSFLEAKRDTIADLLEEEKAASEALATNTEQDEEDADYEEKPPLLGEAYIRRIQHLQEVIEEIEHIRTVYIPELEESQRLFDTDKKQWIENQIQAINLERAPLEQQKAALESEPEVRKTSKLSRKITDSKLAQKVAELQTINAKLKILDDRQAKMKKMASGEKPKAWIKVREPYYIYVPLGKKQES